MRVLGEAPVSRVDRAREAEALAHVRNRQRDVALKILMVVYGDLLAGFIARLVVDRDQTKRIYQDVFLRAFRGIRRFERAKHDNMWAWLCKITYERFLEEERRDTVSDTLPTPAMRNGVDRPDVGTDAPVAPSGTMDDRSQQVEHCLAALPSAHRAQLLMRFALGLSDADIGMAVGLTPDTVELNISRIQTRLRRCMDSKEDAP